MGMKIEKIDVDKYRAIAGKMYNVLQKEKGINNLTDAYIVTDLMKSGMEKAQPELRRMKKTINEIKQEINKRIKEGENNE